MLSRVVLTLLNRSFKMIKRARLASAAFLIVLVIYVVIMKPSTRIPAVNRNPVLKLDLAVNRGPEAVRSAVRSPEAVRSPAVPYERIKSRPKWHFRKATICQGQTVLAVTNEELLTYNFTYSLPGYQLPSKDYLCSLTVPQLEFIYAWYFNNTQTLCGTSKRFGMLKDGGWDVCLDRDLIRKDHCLVYSFGINFDFSFDDEIAEYFGCKVHSFDPSMNRTSYERSSLVSFHNLGVSATNEVTPDAKWKMLTFQRIREELNHVLISPDIVKMDIEDWEWHVIPEMLRSNSFKGVKQFLIEFHFSNIPEADTEGFWLTKLLMIKDLYDLGYRTTRISRNIPNVWKSRASGKDIYECLEVAFIRRS